MKNVDETVLVLRSELVEAHRMWRRDYRRKPEQFKDINKRIRNYAEKSTDTLLEYIAKVRANDKAKRNARSRRSTNATT